MAQAPPQYSYAPPPPELPYYNALFSAADKTSANYLSGPTAVEFLSLSKLPVDLLKQIWTMADQPASNTLDANKFYVAVRLIQLFQNGKKPVDLALNLAEGDAGGVRPPYFDGVNIQQLMAQQQQAQAGHQPPQQHGQPPAQQHQQLQPSPQMQGQPQPSPHMQPQPSPHMQPQMVTSPQMSPMRPAQQPTMNGAGPHPPLPMQPAMNGAAMTTLTVQDPYIVTPQELARYEQLFPSYSQPDDPNNPNSPKFIHGAAAVELFSKSGMDRDSLKTIWTMVDDPIDNKLDVIEFGIAMHLIVCITKKGLPMPPGELPASLKGAVLEFRQKQQEGGIPGSAQPPSDGTVAGMPGLGFRQKQQEGGIPGSAQPPSDGTVAGMPGLGGMPQMGQPQMQQPQMQQQQMGQPQMAMQQPQMQQQPPQQQQGMQQMQQGMQQMGLAQGPEGFAGEPLGGLTVDDAFAGLSNEPVPSVDEYSSVGGMENDGGMSTNDGHGGMGSDMSTIGGMGGGMSGGMSTIGGMAGHQPVVQDVATPELSPQPVYQTVQPTQAMPAPPLQQQQQQHAHIQQPHLHSQQTQQVHNKPPISPGSHAAARRAASKSVAASSGTSSSAELIQLREAHQKLHAEVISLRAKAATVSEEEQETQKEMSQLAVEIGRLGLELSEMKEALMESKVKLADAVGTLKVQMEKKESLETQVAEVKEIQETLTSATVAIENAHDLAVAQQARAVAAAAAAKEEAESFVPPPQQPAVATADLFSWEAPAAPTQGGGAMGAHDASNMAQETMMSWGNDATSVHSSSQNLMGGQDTMPHRGSVDSQQMQQHAAPDPWGSSDDVSVAHSVYSKQGQMGNQHSGAHAAAPPTPGKEDSFGMYAASNPNPYGMGMGGADMFGGAMGGAPAPQPAMSPMGASVASHFVDNQSVAGSVAPSTPNRTAFDDQIAAAAAIPNQPAPVPAPAPMPVGPPSPSKKELEAIRSETTKAEKTFHHQISLVRSLSVDITNLESAAQKAESEMKAMEGKKKSGFGGKKKKAKKEYEKALETTQRERSKVQHAKEQLASAEREADNAKREMEEYRQKYEQMELEAATAASYASVQASSSNVTNSTSALTSVQPSDSYSVAGSEVGGQSVAGGYADPFSGMMSAGHQHPPAAVHAGTDPYGMGAMGGTSSGGDYDNPFAI